MKKLKLEKFKVAELNKKKNVVGGAKDEDVINTSYGPTCNTNVKLEGEKCVQTSNVWV